MHIFHIWFKKSKLFSKGSRIVEKYIEHSNNVPIMMLDKSECDD